MVKADQESFLENGLLLKRECGISTLAHAHKVLEVNLTESKLAGANFALILTNLEDNLSLAVTPVVLPETNRDDFALGLEDEIEARHFNADTSCAWQ